MSRYAFQVKKQEVIEGERRCPDVNISSGSWKPEARIEIPNCIKGHCPSLPVCVPNPVSAMFHYLNYYHLTQRWTQPRTPPESQRWVEREGERMEEREGWRRGREGGRGVKETVLYCTKKKAWKRRHEKEEDRERGWRDWGGWSCREKLSKGINNKRRTNWECRDGLKFI